MRLRGIERLIIVLALSPLCGWAQQRPLVTQDVDLVRPGHILFEFGFDFLQNERFPVSGLKGDLTSAGVIGVNFGLGETVEFQVSGTAANFLTVNERIPSFVTPHLSGDGRSTTDIGDWVLATKIRILPEGRRRPSMGFRVALQLPNSDQSHGIGVNSTNVFGSFLFGKHFGKLNAFSNIGIGILTSPTQLFSQNDVLTYGVAGIYPLTPHVSLAGEINGRWSTRSGPAPLGTESLSQARLGLQVVAAGFRWDVAAIKGITRVDPQSGITFGVSKDFRAFEIPTSAVSK
ncbi:MAG: hypothetical protein LAO31_14225 [Acidobacteriia bacterium]|nr:hypothetical protein [Terriglobia bacterium]